MTHRIFQLKQELARRNCLEIWDGENMRLWRMTTPDQPEKWFAPTGEELQNAEEVATYLLSLPKGGSRAKLLTSAPKSNWEGLELEMQEPDNTQEWLRAKILARQDSTSVCTIELRDGSRREVDICQVRCRWVTTKPKATRRSDDMSKPGLRAKSERRLNKNNINTDKKPAETLRWVWRPRMLLKDEIVKLRRSRLLELSKKAEKVLQGNVSERAANMATLAEAADGQLMDLEYHVDSFTELISREKAFEELISTIGDINGSRENDRSGWVVFFEPQYSGEFGGDAVYMFEKSNEVVAGLANMAKRLGAPSLPLPEVTDGSLAFYRCLDIVESLEYELDRYMVEQNSA